MSALPIVSNVADQDDVEKMIDATVVEFGRLDIIVNNAAAPYGNDRVSVMDMQAGIFKSIVDVKLMGTFYTCKAAATQMVKQGEGGRIVNLSSTMGKSGRPNTSAYNAANFAVDGFTQALAKEMGVHDITVNSVCPGLIETSRLDPMGRTDRWDTRLAEIPLRRAGTDEEVGEPMKQRKRKTNELFAAIGNVIGLNENDVEAVFDVLPHVIAEYLREGRAFTFPGVMRLKLKAKKEQPEKLKKIFDKEVTVRAKPASLRIQATILKPLKVAVSAAGQ